MTTTQRHSLIQVLKFTSIGLLNTVVDFAVLNILIFAFGTGENGELYVVIKAISFIAAVINSYLFNKYWVFKGSTRTSKIQEGFLFFVVSEMGFILNVSISSGVFLFLSTHTYLNSNLEANAGALIGSISVLLWNFFGYKLIVFKNQK